RSTKCKGIAVQWQCSHVATTNREPVILTDWQRRQDGPMRTADTAPTLRAADAGDVDAIVALVDSAYRGETSRQGWTTEASLLEGQRTDLAAISAAIASANTRLIVAMDAARQLIGCGALERVDPERAYFGTFAVRPSQQGTGLGKRLLAEAERYARSDWGCERLELQVIAQRTELIE